MREYSFLVRSRCSVSVEGIRKEIIYHSGCYRGNSGKFRKQVKFLSAFNILFMQQLSLRNLMF